MRNLTDEDIDALVKRLTAENAHVCRFESISKDDLRHSIEWYKNQNKVLSEIGSTARKTLIASIVVFAATTAILGLVAKLKQHLIP